MFISVQLHVFMAAGSEAGTRGTRTAQPSKMTIFVYDTPSKKTQLAKFSCAEGKLYNLYGLAGEKFKKLIIL